MLAKSSEGGSVKIRQVMSTGMIAALFALSSVANANPMIKIAGYNVQNLFDTYDDPNTSDEEFTPRGAQHWTEEVLEDKMRNLGEVFRQMNADVVGMTEVENEAIVRRFMDVGLAGQGYTSYAVADTRDGRGIRTAVVSRYPIHRVKSHDVSNPEWIENGRRKFSRDILEVTVDVNGTPVTVFVSHWLSKAGGAIRDGWRRDEANALTKIMRDIARNDPARLMVAVGDFNDTLDGPSLRNTLDLAHTFADFMRSSADKLFATDRELESLPPRDRGTHYFHPGHEWNTLDHMFIMAGDALKSGRARGFNYVPGSTEVVHPRFVSHEGFPQGCEIIRGANTNNNRNRNGNRRNAREEFRTSCPNGASDHFPMSAMFELN